MSRRHVPDNPWQNGMPPFGYWPPQMHPMMNTGPMWAPQGSLPFMGGGSVAPDMMRYRGNVSSHTNFRRPYDQPERYRPRHGYDDRYGNRQGRGDRKRHGPSGERSRSPASKRGAPHRDGAQNDQEQPNRQGTSEGEASAAENEAERASGTQADDLYDPAEPTTEDTVEGAETAEGQEQRATGEGDATESADQEGGSAGQQNEVGSGEGASTSTGAAAKPSGSKASGTKGAVAKGQTGGRVAQKARQELGNKKGGQKDGWCTVCETNFVGHFFDHRKLDEHKKKRDEKYPKCHTCSMSFSNREHYDHHCGGIVHLKNVEVEEDVQLTGSDGTLGEEYLEEMRGYFCTLCKVFMKEEQKPHHCKTLGHHKRTKDAKRKEAAGKNAKSANENTEDEEDETNQVAYTITDEVGSDDEARTAASDGAGPSGVTIKPKKENVAEETDHTMRETPDEPSRVEPVMLESEADSQSEPVKEKIKEQDDHQEEHQAEEEDAPEHEAASTAMSVLDEQEQTNVPSTNGCNDPKEEVGEKPVAAAPSTSAAPATFKAALSKAAPAKAPGRNLAAPKAAAAVAKPAATVAAKPAVTIPRPTAAVSKPTAAVSKPTAAVSKSTGTVAKPPVAAARVPAVNSAASTSASAAAGTKKPPAVALPAPAATTSASAAAGTKKPPSVALPAPAVTTSASAAAGTKKPPAVALPAPAVTVPAPAAVAGRGGTARGRGRGASPKAVRARKR